VQSGAANLGTSIKISIGLKVKHVNTDRLTVLGQTEHPKVIKTIIFRKVQN